MQPIGSTPTMDSQRRYFSCLFDFVRSKSDRPHAESISNQYVVDFLRTSGLSEKDLASVWTSCMRSEAKEVKKKNFCEAIARVAVLQNLALPKFQGVETPIIQAPAQSSSWLPPHADIQSYLNQF